MIRDRNWGDDDDDDDYETAVDPSTGIKERVKTTTNSKGQKVRTIQRIKVQEIKKLTPKGVLLRRNLPKFGAAVRETDFRDCVSREIGIMEYPGDDDVDQEPDPVRLTLGSRPEIVERDAKDVDGDDEVVEKREKEIEFKPRPGMENLEPTIRVSNLSKTVNDSELRDLFQMYGKVVKVSIPKVMLPNGTKEVRGFAYITYEFRSSAEAAMNNLNGRGFDHLILKLEWAKPAKDGGGGNGLSSGYVSGYGKQLAQDTKEKVVFTSHGNSTSGW